MLSKLVWIYEESEPMEDSLQVQVEQRGRGLDLRKNGLKEYNSSSSILLKSFQKIERRTRYNYWSMKVFVDILK